jgi:UDP-N-acetylglucosamine--dolichyl-phosphate N-acetylglucosaminephosphotransferase
MLVLVTPILSFFVVYLILPYVIRYFKFVRIVTADVHKYKRPLIPSSAGVPLVAGILAGLLTYVFLTAFLSGDRINLLEIFAAMTSILIIMFSGFIDDINSAQVEKAGYPEGKRGLKTWQKPLLTIPAAVPLMSILVGGSVMNIPLLGPIDFGILYPLFIVPVAVVGSANMINMLGGFNGLEAGMGLVYTFSLGLFAYFHNSIIAALLFFSTFASLLAILKFNFYPAKILSGDSLTYTLGAVVAAGAVIGKLQKAALLTMIPFLIQGTLKFYSYMKLGRFASDLGILQKNGTIKPKYDKIYSWTHFVMKFGNVSEREIVLIMVVVQIFFSLLPFLNLF